MLRCHVFCGFLLPAYAFIWLHTAAQAEHAIQDPTLVDIRLMRDFSGQRPVDVALSFGYERLAVLLDPSQPIELLSSHVGRGVDHAIVFCSPHNRCGRQHTVSIAYAHLFPLGAHMTIMPQGSKRSGELIQPHDLCCCRP